MKTHNIPIVWKNKSAYESRSLLSEGFSHSTAFKNLVSFEIGNKTESIGKFGFDPGVVVAIVSSTVALGTSLLTCIAQIVSANMNKRNAVMEIHLNDGSMVKIPLSATASDIERLLETIRAIDEVKQINVTSNGDLDT